MSREDVLQELDETRAEHVALVLKVAPDTLVYPDSGWLVKDIIAHVTHWELQSLLTLEHSLRGERYFIPNFRELGIDGWNARDYELHREDTFEQVMENFEGIRQSLKKLVFSMSDEQWEQTVRWFGNEVTAERMLYGILWHEKHHMGEIAALLSVVS
jgi:uncharacterized damage-inducible protein DinB